MGGSEREKMLAGEFYLASDPELVGLRRRARRLTRQYNDTDEDALARRHALLGQLMGVVPEQIEIEPPFRCDYGFNIRLGANFYMNFDGVILDCALVEIGDNVLCGPGVHIYTASHPILARERASGLEFAQPVKVGADVWLGDRVVLCPGVTIGAGATIGAGSVVTRDIPAGVFAAGAPCQVIRRLTPEDCTRPS